MKRWIVGCLSMLILMVAPIGAAAQEPDAFDGAFGVRSVAVLAETYVKCLIDAMHVMTATDEMKSGDWTRMKPLLAQFEESELSYNAWFLRPDGSYYKVATDLATANLADRTYFPRVMSGETTLGDLVLSRSTGRKSMVLTAPVDVGGQIIGALGVTLYLDDFSNLLNSKLQFPAGISFYAHNEIGEISLHTNPARLLEPIASAAVQLMPGGLEVTEFLGWTFVLGTNEP